MDPVDISYVEEGFGQSVHQKRSCLQLFKASSVDAVAQMHLQGLNLKSHCQSTWRWSLAYCTYDYSRMYAASAGKLLSVRFWQVYVKNWGISKTYDRQKYSEEQYLAQLYCTRVVCPTLVCQRERTCIVIYHVLCVLCVWGQQIIYFLDFMLVPLTVQARNKVLNKNTAQRRVYESNI